MGILTLLRNAFGGRSRKAAATEAEGTVPSQQAAEPKLPSPATEPTPPSPATATVPEPRTATLSTDSEHELVSAAFDNVEVPKEGTPDEGAHAETAASQAPAGATAPEAGQPTEEATAPAESPTSEDSATELGSSAGEPVAEEPAAEEPVAEEQPAEEAAATEEPLAEKEPEASVEEPVAQDAVADETAAEEPAPEKPVAEEPVAEDTAVAEPVAEAPAPAAAEEEQPQVAETAPEPAVSAEPEPEPGAESKPVAETASAAEPEPITEATVAAAPEPVVEPEPEPEPVAAPSAADNAPAADDETVTDSTGGNNDSVPATLRTAYTAAAATLSAHGLTGTTATTYLVLDRSASMRAYYKDGSAQALGEQTLALAAHLDPAAKVHVVFFSTELDGTGELTLTEHENKIDELHAGLGRMGRTSYHAAVEEVLTHHTKNSPDTPALVVFQTDGAPDAKTPATQALTEAAKTHPTVFFSFVAFGDPENKAFDYLRKLKHPNTSHFLAGETPKELTDAEIYEGILGNWRP
ncbi:VWA domain-containing protein [Streptomyces sp. NPDC019531]|uniref:VWA domain-containing protein n=1 Tax=Streptomyces sp. NPDC019531 TaxID=3365062 RepID=UPI00384B6626